MFRLNARVLPDDVFANTSITSSRGQRLLRPLAAAVVLAGISGCMALPHDADSGPVTIMSGNSSVENAPERLSGHVSKETTVWRAGSLEGFCSVQFGGDSADLVVDDVLLSTDTLFDTAVPTLSESGLKVMDELSRRLARYEDIKRIELVGHADERGSAAKNYRLAADRAESVRGWLAANINEPLNMRVLSVGESRASEREHVQDLAHDRRVDVRIIASGVTGNNIDTTLCSIAGGDATSTTTTALRVHAQGALSDQVKRNRLEAYNGELPLSPGDQLSLAIAGDEDWNGIYEVSVGGGIDIPLLGRQTVAGLTIPAVKTILADALIDKQLIRPAAVNVDATVVEWAAVEVFVRGAVFQKGRVSINYHKPEVRELRAMRDGGDHGQGRLLSFALQQAGGVRPDADLSSIQILRHGDTIPVDLSGLAHGELARDVPLIAGDEVIVASTGRFDKNLVAPTHVTPPGIRIFSSNATAPVLNNAAAHITKDETSLPYGSRLIQALISMNCIGGAQSVNAARRAVMISTDYITGDFSVTERSVNRLLSEPNRIDVNPFLMPGDSVACFDADVSNIREIARTVTDLLAPMVSLSVIFGQF